MTRFFLVALCVLLCLSPAAWGKSTEKTSQHQAAMSYPAAEVNPMPDSDLTKAAQAHKTSLEALKTLVTKMTAIEKGQKDHPGPQVLNVELFKKVEDSRTVQVDAFTTAATAAASLATALTAASFRFESVEPMFATFLTTGKVTKEDFGNYFLLVSVAKSSSTTIPDSLKTHQGLSVHALERTVEKELTGGDEIRECWYPSTGTVGGFFDNTVTHARYGVTNNHVISGPAPSSACTGLWGFGTTQGAFVATDLATDSTIFDAPANQACTIGAVNVAGSANPVFHGAIWKRGATSGMTNGVVEQTAANGGLDVYAVAEDAAGLAVMDYTVEFTRPGDSGSFYVNGANQVIGLHKSKQTWQVNGANRYRSVGTRIDRVIQAMTAAVGNPVTAC